MRPHGGRGSTSNRFQSRLGSGSTRGSMAMNSPEAEGSTPSQATQKLEMSVQDRAHTNDNELTVAESTPTQLRADDLGSSSCQSILPCDLAFNTKLRRH